MNISINTKNYTLTPSEDKILNQKTKNIQRLFRTQNGNPTLKIEIEELVKFDDLGNKYRVEAYLTFYDKSVYISKLNTTLFRAMDETFCDLKNQSTKETKKFKTNIIKRA